MLCDCTNDDADYAPSEAIEASSGDKVEAEPAAGPNNAKPQTASRLSGRMTPAEVEMPVYDGTNFQECYEASVASPMHIIRGQFKQLTWAKKRVKVRDHGR
mmetsp:Transcript_43788/g.111909  ORF Transcript_43788/g.111909 Transcript_43788/m.111909 type:complete len:101 (-) Transcript_43788:1329-1631(-)